MNPPTQYTPLLDTLASYVPGLILRYLADDPTPLADPSAERLPVAILFADISGFTPLTERFARRGPAGAEELSRLLNAYFDQLIDLITIHGGDIIKFAGDGVPAVWPARDEDLVTVTHRAAQCGLAMQEKLSQYQVAEGLHLSLHVGLGAGDVFAASVGGVLGRWEFVVAGDPLAQISAAERQAQPGQVVLSPQAWELVEERCLGTQLPEGGWLLEGLSDSLPLRPLFSASPTPGSEVALRGYVPGAILDRLDADQTGWLAELRRVTVLFINVIGIDYGAPDALAQVQEVMRALQKVLYHYEGSVNQFVVDDKGTTLVAAMGLPPLTHEDDAVRGVQAALGMHSELERLGLRSSVGVTTGQVFCGGRGNETRREYAMIGDTVNMSARLMVAASRQEDDQALPILCDEATYQAARSRLTFDSLPPIRVKGKAEPMAVYRPYSQTPGLGKSLWSLVRPSATIVGRVAERKLLKDQLRDMVAGGPGGLIVVEGEAGIGKSRLVGDLLVQTEPLNVIELIGAGDAIEQSTPYHAWRPIFRQLFDLSVLSSDTETQRQQVLAWLSANYTSEEEREQLFKLAPLLNAVLPLDLPENDITGQMVGQVRADNTRLLLRGLLEKATEQDPTLLILEDAHWLDSASWALALDVSQHVQPNLFVIATRPMNQPLPREYRQMLQAPRTRHMLLEGLSPEDTVALVCQNLGIKSLPEPVVALIQEKAQGNPFFSEELAYALRDSGMIEIVDGECRIPSGAGDLSNLSLPDTVQGIITSRIDRLEPSQQLALKVASVIGRVFAFRLLRDIYPIDTDKENLADYMGTLQKLDMTPLDKPEPDPIYIFKHIITQEVAYNLMLFSQRRQLHRAVAEWYERTYSDDLSPFYPLLAHHWSKAEEAPKAIKYLEKAGEQALHTYANREAIRFFSQALNLMAEVDVSLQRQVRWQRQLGEAYLGLGQLKQSQEHLERALALLDRPVPGTSGETMAQLVGQVWQQARRSVRPTKSAPSSSQDRPLLLEAARACGGLGQIYFYANERILNLYANLCSLNLAEQVGPSPELAQSYANACIAAGLVPLHPVAQAYGRRARDIASSVEHLPSLAWVLLITAVYDIGTGRWANAREGLTQAIEITDRLGDRRRWQQGMNTLATVMYLQGEFSQGVQAFAELYAVAERRNDAQYRAYGLLGQARCLLALGRPDEAISLLMAVEMLLGNGLGRVEEIYTHGLLSLTHWRRGEKGPALQAAETAAGLIAQSEPISYNLLDAYAAVTQVYLDLWQADVMSAARESPPLSFKSSWSGPARRACKALRDFAKVFPIGRPRARLYQGRMRWLSGRARPAQRCWHKSLTLATKLDMPYEQGLAHYEIGRHLLEGDPDRQTHLARAGEIFERLGAAYDLARVQQASTDLPSTR